MYDLTFSREDGYVRVEVNGEAVPGREYKDAEQMLRTVAAYSRENEVNQILIVIRISGQLPDFAAFNIGNNPEKYGWRRQFKLACVFTFAERLQSNLFTESVARNRGYLVRLFNEESAAIPWLLDPQSF